MAALGWAAFAASVAGVWLGPAAAGVCGAGCGLAGLAVSLLCFAGRAFPGQGLLVWAKPLWAKGAGRLVAPLLAAAFVLGLISWQWNAQGARVQHLDGATAYARVQVMNYPEKSYGSCQYKVTVTHLDHTPVEPFSMLLTSSTPLAARPYEWTECEIRFSAPKAGGLYSQQNRLLADGCVIKGSTYGSGVRVRNTLWSPGRQLLELRRMVGRAVSQYLPSAQAGLVKTLLLGQGQELPQAAYLWFRKIGCTHMLAVSGLHLTVMVGLLSLLCRRLALSRRGKNLVRAMLLFVCMCITGFPPGVQRSGAMFFLYLAADSLHGVADSQNALGAAVLLICLFQPFSGGDLGFSLSALSTLGILTLYKPLMVWLMKGRRILKGPRLRGLLRPFASACCVTLSATLFTLPIQLLVFGGLSLIAPLSNFLLMPLMLPLLYCSILLGLAATLSMWPVFGALAQPLAFCTGWLGRFFLGAAHWLARLPGVYFQLDQGPWLLALCGGALLAVLIWIFKRTGRRPRPLVRLGVACASLLLAFSAGSQWLANRNCVTLAIAGSQDAPCVLMMKNSQAVALSLGGYRAETAEEILEKNHILSLTGIFLPASGPQARAMALSLADIRPVGRVLLPEGAYLPKELLGLEAPVQFLSPGQSFQALGAERVLFTQDGKRLEFTLHGVPVIVELEPSGPGSCSILITSDPQTQIQRETLFLVGAKEQGENTLANAYFAPDEAEGMYLRFSPQGEVAAGTYSPAPFS